VEVNLLGGYTKESGKKYVASLVPIKEESVKELMFTERELEIAYCIGLLNRMLTMDELSIELKTAQEKINNLKEAFKRGDFNIIKP